MNILFVSHSYPNANGRGHERRAAQHLASLTKLGAITLVIDSAAAEAAQSAGCSMSDLAVQQVIVRHEATRAEVSHDAYDKTKTKMGRLVQGLRRRHHTYQYALESERSRYHKILSSEFDLVFAFRISSAIWVQSVLGSDMPRISIVDFDDIESIALARASAFSHNSLFWRLIERQYVRELKKTEKRLATTWSLALVCSSYDVSRLRARGLKSLSVPNAVRFPRSIIPEPNDKRINLLFVATLNYKPNVDGIVWFVSKVWPHVRAELENRVSLTIVGYDPLPPVLALRSIEGVEVSGQVPELAPVYAKSNIVLAPIFFGGGTRIKILEAFAFQRAIVTTSIGCEGLDLANGHHAMIADTAESFVRAVVELSTSASMRRALARNGYEFGRENYSDEVVSANFDRALKNLLEDTA